MLEFLSVNTAHDHVTLPFSTVFLSDGDSRLNYFIMQGLPRGNVFRGSTYTIQHSVQRKQKLAYNAMLTALFNSLLAVSPPSSSSGSAISVNFITSRWKNLQGKLSWKVLQNSVILLLPGTLSSSGSLMSTTTKGMILR